MKINKQHLMKISLLIFIFSMPFGYKLFERFAISNIGQLVSFVLVLPIILSNLNKRYLNFNIIMITLMFLAAICSSMRYSISMHWGHIGFFALISLYISFYVMEIRKQGDSLIKLINDCFKISAYVFVLPYTLMGVNSIFVRRQVYSSYMFDDKSHAVIFFTFYAFATIVLFENKYKYVLSFLFFILSLTTTSRLGVIFIPFYILAFYKENVSESKSRGKKLLIATVSIGVVGLALWFVYKNSNYFSVFGRMGTSEGSTRSHLTLIFYSIKIKFSNLVNFLFGTGPGSFSNILVASGMDLSAIQRDGGSYRAILAGILPVHSSHFELLMDFSLIGFFIYIKFLWSIFRNQIKEKRITEVLYFIAFMGAELFYSTFHEGLFYMILLFLFANSWRKQGTD